MDNETSHSLHLYLPHPSPYTKAPHPYLGSYLVVNTSSDRVCPSCCSATGDKQEFKLSLTFLSAPAPLVFYLIRHPTWLYVSAVALTVTNLDERG